MNTASMLAAARRLGYTRNSADQVILSAMHGYSTKVYLDEALESLRHARDSLILARTPRTLEKVRSALKSLEGAQRHARLAPIRKARQS